MPLQEPTNTSTQRISLPRVAEAARMFSEAAGHSGRTGATSSFLRVIAESLKLLAEGQSVVGESRGLPFRGFSGAKEAMNVAVARAMEACASLQILCGPFVNVNLVVTDARPEQAGLTDFVTSAGAQYQTLMPFNELPVVLFSPCLSPLDILLRAASTKPQSVEPSGSGRSGIADKEKSPRLTKESTPARSFAHAPGASTARSGSDSDLMSEETARVLAWHSSRALSGLQAALSAAVAISRLGCTSTLLAAKAAVAKLRLPLPAIRTVPRPVPEALDVVAGMGNINRQSSGRATNLPRPSVSLPEGHVPSWYTRGH